MGTGTDAAVANPMELLALALGLSQDQVGELHDLAGMHGGDPVELVRGLILAQLEFVRTCSTADVEVIVHDFT
jgi:hypothetical protein